MNYSNSFASNSQGIDYLSENEDISKYLIAGGFSCYEIPENFAGKPWVFCQIKYKDYKYWYALCKFNNIRLPYLCRTSFRLDKENPYQNNIITDFYEGRLIVVPIKSVLDEYMSNTESK